MPKNKDLTNKKSGEEAQEFRHAIKNVKPIKSDKVFLKKPRTLVKKTAAIKTPLPDIFDYEPEAPVLSEEALFFARSGVQHKTLRKLRHGKLPVEGELDLHGFNVKAAKEKLFGFLATSMEKHWRCVRIVHGKSRLYEKPILKNKLNNWLRQMDIVLAFCSAVPSGGGTGAIYVLLKQRD